MSPNSTETVLDYRVSDLKKRLDKLKYKTAQQRSYLDKLLVQQQKLSNETSEKVTVYPAIQPFHLSQTGNGKRTTTEILGERDPQDISEDDGGGHGEEQVRSDPRHVEEGEDVLLQATGTARRGSTTKE